MATISINMPANQPIVPADHCVLCELSRTDYTSGAFCSLTGKKPTFTSTCNKAHFDATMQAAIVEANVLLQKTKKAAPGATVALAAYGIAGLALVVAAVIFGFVMLVEGWVETGSWVVLPIGFTLSGFGVRTYVNHRQELGVAKRKVARLDALLARYGIGYTIDVEVQNGPHGTQEVSHHLTMTTIPRKAEG